MATALTLDQLTAKLRSEPAKEGRENKLTTVRRGNVLALVNNEGNEDYAPGFSVDEERTLDGKNGQKMTVASIVAAYKRIVKDNNLGDKVTVRHLLGEDSIVVYRHDLIDLGEDAS
jgi:hypothetical protein